MENLVKSIIKAVVEGSSERAGCCDDDKKMIKKLNKLVDRWIAHGEPEIFERIVKALGELASYGIELKNI